MSLFDKLNNKRYDLQEINKKFSKNSSGKVPVGGSNQNTGRVGDLPVDDIPEPKTVKKINRKLDTDEKKLTKLIDQEGKQMTKFTKKLGKSTRKAELTKKFKKPIKLVKKINKYIKKSPVDTILGKSTRYDKMKSFLKRTSADLKQKNKAAKYTALINSTNKNRPEYGFENKRGGANKKFFKYTKQFAKAEKRPLGDVVSRVTKDRASKGLKIGDIDFKNSEKLAQQRAARIDPLTGKATKKGVENYVLNRRNQSYVSDAQMKKNQAQAKKIISNPTGKEYKKIEKTINQSSYAGKRSLPATKKELKKTYKAIKTSPTFSTKAPLDGRNIQKIQTPLKTKTKSITTPKRVVKLLKPVKALKTIATPELEKIKPKVTTGNQIPFVQTPPKALKKIATPELEKIKPKVTSSKTAFVQPPAKKKILTQTQKLSQKLMKNKNKYAKIAGVTLATGAAILGTNRVMQAQKKQKKAIAALAKDNPKNYTPVNVDLFLNKSGTSPSSKSSNSKIPSYAKPSISSKDIKPPKPISKKERNKINQQVNKYVSDRK